MIRTWQPTLAALVAGTALAGAPIGPALGQSTAAPAATGTPAQPASSVVSRIREHMEVRGSDDGHVGTVDKVEGDTIVLTRDDPAAGGRHHLIPVGWVARVDQAVRLNMTAPQARERWQPAPAPGGDRPSR
ncbi:DUF2171 domain-containing protein [Roseomonas sp. NAR14]|uniref:DUF2171 domain-containing protein n=1 Tax=Roseomonas acroporae TaxID=2937791 RepID=A0A9X1Y3K4_9PROT|nr:DUF2171 domain-containing protein [Roseomonas acroporae]MCK8782916.1 DUF2171 domain-containing protein [Roseomonas acroporae]